MTRTSAAQSKARRNCFETHKRNDDAGNIYLDCHLCGGRINPAVEAWVAEHAVRHALTADDSPANVLPAHARCARAKDKIDISENAKGKRVSDKHFGIVKKSGWWKPDGYKHRWGQR